jgi:hypothetical protein
MTSRSRSLEAQRRIARERVPTGRKPGSRAVAGATSEL